MANLRKRAKVGGTVQAKKRKTAAGTGLGRTKKSSKIKTAKHVTSASVGYKAKKRASTKSGIRPVNPSFVGLEDFSSISFDPLDN